MCDAAGLGRMQETFAPTAVGTAAGVGLDHAAELLGDIYVVDIFFAGFITTLASSERFGNIPVDQIVLRLAAVTLTKKNVNGLEPLRRAATTT